MIGNWGSATYITSQVFVTAGYVLLAMTYFITARNKQLATMIFSNLSMGIGFALLSGWIGVCMCIIAIVRDITSSIIHKNRSISDQQKTNKLDWWLLALWISLLTTATVFTVNGFLALFAYFATLTFTISIWQKNGFIYRLLGIFVGLFWIIYNIFIQSFMGLTLESFSIIFVIIGLIVYIKNQRKLKLLKS